MTPNDRQESLRIVGAVLVLAVLLAAAAWPQDKPVDVRLPDSPKELQSASVVGHALKLAEEPLQRDQLGRIQLPEGFSTRIFAKNLRRPRMMAISNQTVYVTEQDAGRVTAFDASTAFEARAGQPIAQNLDSPHGLTVHDGYLYVATVKEVLRGPIRDDGSVGRLEAVIDDLPDGGQHPNRTLAFGPDGALFVSVGSTCNNCEEPNEESATLLRVEPASWGRAVYATGLRNTIGFGWHPETGALWGMDHGSDWRGDDEPPEELNRIEQGKNYGWPFCYGDQQPDPLTTENPKGKSKAEHCRQTAAPRLTYQAHSAPIGMVFYDGDSFPEEFLGDAFVAMRGSWNREPATGYKVVRIRFGQDGEPEEFVDFATGWLIGEKDAEMGRLAGVAVSPSGSLLVSEDRNGVIYEIYRSNPE